MINLTPVGKVANTTDVCMKCDFTPWQVSPWVCPGQDRPVPPILPARATRCLLWGLGLGQASGQTARLRLQSTAKAFFLAEGRVQSKGTKCVWFPCHQRGRTERSCKFVTNVTGEAPASYGTKASHCCSSMKTFQYLLNFFFFFLKTLPLQPSSNWNFIYIL